MKFKYLTEVVDAIKTFEFERKEFLSRPGESKKRDRDGLRIQNTGQPSSTPHYQDHRVKAKRSPNSQIKPWQPRPPNPRPTQN